MAASTAGTSACTRASTLALAASSPSTSAMAGDFAGVACAAAAPRARRLITPQARTDFLDQLLDFIGLLERGDGEDIAVVLFQVLLQLFRQIGQPGCVLQVLFVLGL